MRRVASIILFVLGGWMLTSEAMVAWMDMGLGLGPQLLMLVFFLPIAGVPLGLGAWASPGNRPAELGLTLMITAAVGAFCAVAVWLAMNDPQFLKMLPPDQQFPQINAAPMPGSINLLLIAAAGYLLWRAGRSRARAKAGELERVFGD